MFKNCICIFISLVLLASCSKPVPSLAPSVPQAGIYLVGYYFPGNNTRIACYWKNGVLVPLENGNMPSEAIDIMIDEQDIYIIGSYGDKPCYWKNNEPRKMLELRGNAGYVTSAIIKNSVLYITGTTGGLNNVAHVPCYWKNEKFHILGEGNGTTNGIAVHEDNVYICGFEGGDNKACYWKNEQKQVIAESGNAEKILVNNSGIYIAGYVHDLNAFTQTWGYWKNGEFTPVAGSGLTFNNMAIKENNLYIAGGNGIQAKVWINGTETSLSKLNTYSRASDIEFKNDDVYISGYVENVNNVNMACYWKNGQLSTLSTPNSYANAISIIE